MADSKLQMSPKKSNAAMTQAALEDDADMTCWHDPPSSPFVAQLEDDQENIAPAIETVSLVSAPSSVPFDSPITKASPQKRSSLKHDRNSAKLSPRKPLQDAHTLANSCPGAANPSDQEEEVVTRHYMAPEEIMKTEIHDHPPTSDGHSLAAEPDNTLDIFTSPPKLCRSLPQVTESSLNDNEGKAVSMQIMQEMHTENFGRAESGTTQIDHFEAEAPGPERMQSFPDGPDFSMIDADDTCFSTFSEMPGMDMTKFAMLRQSPSKEEMHEQATPRPRAHAHAAPSTSRRSARSPSPTPRRSRKDNDTTNLLLDFTAQFEAFSTSRRGSPRGSPVRSRVSPAKSTTEPNLLAFYHNQRSPAKGGQTAVAVTPGKSRTTLNLLDFELPPPPTPRSVPTVTIRELESLKSSFQSQISSLTASLSGKEAQVQSLVTAVSDAERRVGEAQELVREERSAREHAEAQMTDWKIKGEEVQKLLQDVQAELAHNDAEREQLLTRLNDAEKRAEDAEARSSDLETKVIEAESKNVDMTTFISPEDENRKAYSEIECQTAIAEKVNEVARDLHAAYKAKHEKKIKALKDSYQKKADERCKELRVQIIRLERRVEEAEKKRDDTFSKVVPVEFASTSQENCEKCDRPLTDTAATTSPSKTDDLKLLEVQKLELEALKAQVAGLQSELESIRKSHDSLLGDLETERVEKGELVAAAEQMLAMCGEKMGELQQQEMRKSQRGPPPPSSSAASTSNGESSMRAQTGFLAGGAAPTTRPGSAMSGGRPGSALAGERPAGSGIAKPSGIRGPGGFGYGGGGAALSRSISGGKSRILSNIERMGGA